MANVWITLTFYLLMVQVGKTQTTDNTVTEIVTEIIPDDAQDPSQNMTTEQQSTSMKRTTQQPPTTSMPQRQTTAQHLTTAPPNVMPTTPGLCPSECSCDRATKTARCESDTLSSETIPTFPSYITTLILSDNSFPILPKDAFAGLPDLISLYLISCKILTIEPGAFNGLNHLRILHLRYNQILTLESNDQSVLGGLVELEELDLRNNALVTLGMSVLSPTVNLDTLLLDDNNINELQAGVLASNVLLTKITLKNMLLTQIPTGVFTDTPDLQQLELSGNKIKSIPAGAFGDAPNLTELVLATMTLESIDNNAFSTLGKLEILDLLSNNLVSLAKEVLEPLTSLKFLILRSNTWDCNCQMFELVDYLKGTSIDYYTSPWLCVTPRRLNGKRVYVIPAGDFACTPFITSMSETKTIDYGDQAYFECVAYGDPTPDIEWYHPNGQKVTATSNLDNVYTSLKGSVVIIQHASEEENGIFKCIARNDRGEASMNYGLIVQNIPTTKGPTTTSHPTTQAFSCPNAVIDVRATEIKDTTVEMNWIKYNHPMTQGYIVEIAAFASAELPRKDLITPADNTSYLVEDLVPGTNYIICVTAYLPPCPAQTPYGQCKQFKTQGAKDEIAALKKKHTNEIIGTALSMFFGTLLILASIFVILWQYRKPKEYTKYKVNKDTTRFADVEPGMEIDESNEGDKTGASKGKYVTRTPSARFEPNGKVNVGATVDDENSNTNLFKHKVELHDQNGLKPKSNEYEMEETQFDDNNLPDIREEEETDRSYDRVPEEVTEDSLATGRLSTAGLVDHEVSTRF